MVVYLPLKLWDWILNNPATFSQLLFSLALVIATVAYTYYTKGQIDEMEEARKQSLKPVVKGGIGLIGPVNMACTIQNTGKGAAHNVHTKIYFEDMDCEPVEFKTPILTTDEEYEFGFPLGKDNGFSIGMNEIESAIDENDSEGILIVETTCEDAFGREYEQRTEIDVLDVKENLSQIIRDGEEKKIRKAVEGINSSVEDIASEIDFEPQAEAATREIYFEVLDKIESEGTIGFEDLMYQMGLSKNLLYNMIYKMQRGGLVDYSEDKNLRLHDNVEIEWVGGTIADVDKDSIGGASGKQIVEEIQSKVDIAEGDEGAEAGEDDEEEKEVEEETE